MLSEFALIPDLLAVPDGASADLHDASMVQLEALLLTDGLVRNLRAGRWQEHIRDNLERMSWSGKKLFHSLLKEGRLREADATPLSEPEDADGWLYEAIASHRASPNDRKLTAVIAPHELAEEQNDQFIASVRRMHETDWWRARGCSVRLERKTSEYLRHLGPVLRHSNSLMFIDPNLDPTKPNYAEFHELLEASVRGRSVTHIEIHRSRKDGINTPTRSEWMDRFQSVATVVQQTTVNLTVFIWDDFHDRYLISNLIGISVPNGFDICTDEHRYQLRTTWTRLSRRDAGEVQGDHDRAHAGRLHCEPFTVGPRTASTT